MRNNVEKFIEENPGSEWSPDKGEFDPVISPYKVKLLEIQLNSSNFEEIETRNRLLAFGLVHYAIELTQPEKIIIPDTEKLVGNDVAMAVKLRENLNDEEFKQFIDEYSVQTVESPPVNSALEAILRAYGEILKDEKDDKFNFEAVSALARGAVTLLTRKLIAKENQAEADNQPV